MAQGELHNLSEQQRTLLLVAAILMAGELAADKYPTFLEDANQALAAAAVLLDRLKELYGTGALDGYL